MPFMERSFLLQVPSSTENLAMIRDFVSSIGEQAGMDPGDVGKLELAVDEGCTNVIEHAYGRDTTKEVTVRATIDENVLEILISDTGRGFDPTSVEQLELKKLVLAGKSGGLGLRLINKLMDDVRYEIEPGKKNVLRMIKRLKKD